MENQEILPADKVRQISEETIRDNEKRLKSAEGFEQLIGCVAEVMKRNFEFQIKSLFYKKDFSHLQEALQYRARLYPYQTGYSMDTYLLLDREHPFYAAGKLYQKIRNRRKTHQALEVELKKKFAELIEWCEKSGYQIRFDLSMGILWNEPKYFLTVTISW